MLLVLQLKFRLSHSEPISYYSKDSGTVRSILISRLKCSKEYKQLPNFDSVAFPTVCETYVSSSMSQGHGWECDLFSSVAKLLMTEQLMTEHLTVSW
jgi:hypothetical protein